MKLAILANGPSLPSKDDLARVRIPFMGMNRSWMRVPNPDYHVGLEPVHYHANPKYHERVAKSGGLYVVGSGWPCGRKLEFGSGTFSRDVFKDGVVTQMNNVGSVFWAALQVACTLGYRTVYALGLDLYGPHFDGTPASAYVERQNEMFRFVPDDLKVFVAGSPESRAIFPHVSIEEVYGADVA